MATGEVANRSGGVAQEPELGLGEAMTATGRISVARRVLPGKPRIPFSTVQLAGLDEALTLGSRATRLDFSVYLGDLGQDTRARAEQLHASMGERGTHAVVVAVSPAQRVVEIVTGEEASRRLPDRGCKLAVMSMVASFKEDDIFGGLMNGLRILADQAGAPPRHAE